MATTYTLISSNVLTGSAASVTFSAIPSTFTDLVLKCSMRTDLGSDAGNFLIRYNNDASSIYSMTRLEGSGAAASSDRLSAYPYLFSGRWDGSIATANTFASAELYIPNYAGSTAKPNSSSYATENNSSTAYVGAIASLYTGTTAISSISAIVAGGSNFVSGSSFYLYGIKNS